MYHVDLPRIYGWPGAGRPELYGLPMNLYAVYVVVRDEEHQGEFEGLVEAPTASLAFIRSQQLAIEYINMSRGHVVHTDVVRLRLPDNPSKERKH